ncbi:uncharacterized protein EI97DRAFT_436546 [Westerdykella ornata]|uniref:Uncharacterized protein n=1 Tax=Westerdykella ornata TaxID=318751 RepID=A0A6A6JCM5_WESOR|nr:uncharacterized protein EI97DRAFT_436546 [Westerdykella ornata]KAF2272939.1 hypothetical protein EI97DRAFT_436546 [Westerdykella ornata]
MATVWHDSGVHRRTYDLRNDLANPEPYWTYSQQGYSPAQCPLPTTVRHPQHQISINDQPASRFRAYAEEQSSNHNPSTAPSNGLIISTRLTPLASPRPPHSGYAIDPSVSGSFCPTYAEGRAPGIDDAFPVRQQIYDGTLVSPTLVPPLQCSAPVATVLNPAHGFIASSSHVQGGDRETHLHWPTTMSPLAVRQIIHEPTTTNDTPPSSARIHSSSMIWRLGEVQQAEQAGQAARASGSTSAILAPFHMVATGASGPGLQDGQQYCLSAAYLPEDTHHAGLVISSGRRQSASRKAAPRVPATFKPRQKKTKVVKRSGPLSENNRQKTHRMRSGAKMGKGNCIRCRFYKARCDENEICLPCLKIMRAARVCPPICNRGRIELASIARRCNGRFAQPEADFLQYPWKSAKEYIIEFVWNLPGFGPVPGARLSITCREYEPEGSIRDATKSEWETENGIVVSVQQPAYAVSDTLRLQTDVEALFVQHLPQHLPKFKEWILDRTRYNPLSHITFQEAFRLQERGGPGSELVVAALRVQWLSILSQGYGSIRSTDIPGLNQYDYRAMGRSTYEAYNRNSSDRPLPEPVTHACDVSILKLLKQAEARCVKLLGKAIFTSGVKPWYWLLLSFSVITWNMEYIHSGAEGYIRSKVHTHVERQVSAVVSEQMRKWETSFQNILDHWRISLRDFRPFVVARNNPEDLWRSGQLPDYGALEYMKKMAAMLDNPSSGQYAPPMIGPSALTNLLGSRWMIKLMEEAGRSATHAAA